MNKIKKLLKSIKDSIAFKVLLVIFHVDNFVLFVLLVCSIAWVLRVIWLMEESLHMISY